MLQGRADTESTSTARKAPERDEPYERGRRIFHAAARCAECHSHEEVGGIQGPDLTGVGQRLSRSQLEDAVRRPSVSITPGYEAVALLTKGNCSM